MRKLDVRSAASLGASSSITALDKHQIQVGSSLAKLDKWCVLGIVMPGPRVLRRRELDEREASDWGRSALEHLPGTVTRSRDVSSTVLGDQRGHVVFVG
jgi:hypothetical protein